MLCTTLRKNGKEETKVRGFKVETGIDGRAVRLKKRKGRGKREGIRK